MGSLAVISSPLFHCECEAEGRGGLAAGTRGVLQVGPVGSVDTVGPGFIFTGMEVG